MKLEYLQEVNAKSVAPRVGAWIETKQRISELKTNVCRPSRGGVD